MKLSFMGGPSTGKKRTAEAEKKRKKTLTATMEKRRRERNAWYCQCCGDKHYLEERKFYVCESCYKKLKGVKEDE